MGFGENASFGAVPAFGGYRGEGGGFQGHQSNGPDRRSPRGRGGGGNFSDRRENRRQVEDWDSEIDQGNAPSRGRFDDPPQFPARGKPREFDEESGGQKFGDSRSGGFGGPRRNNDSRPGENFNQYRNSNRGGGFAGRYQCEDDRRAFSGHRSNEHADEDYRDNCRSSGRGMYSDEDPPARDRRAGFDNDEDQGDPSNRRSNDFERNERDGGRENWDVGERKLNDRNRFSNSDDRNDGRNRGFGNNADGYRQEYRRRDEFVPSKGNFENERYDDREPTGKFGGYKGNGPRGGGPDDNRGRYQSRPFDSRNDDFDNSGYCRERGNDQRRTFENRSGGFARNNQDGGDRRFDNRFNENEGGYGGGGQSSPYSRRNYGDRKDSGPPGRGRYGGDGPSRGGQRGGSGWNDDERDDRDRRRDGGFRGGSGNGNRNASGYGNRDDNSGGRYRQGPREFVPSGQSVERAPKDWSPEETAIQKLFERDAHNAAHFEKDRDESVQVIGAEGNIEISSWENSGLHSDLIRTCTEKCHYRYVRPIQAAAIPLILSGRDVVGLAETGGGKTAAFVLPILHQIMKMGSETLSSLKSGEILALVVAPTRELARQLYDSFRKHAYGTEVKCCVAYGEIPRWKNLAEIHGGCHVLVGTSGRLMDFIQKSDINVRSVRFLVLDEADMLLEDGRENHLNSILSNEKLPKPDSRQTLLFSATFPADVQKFAGQVLKQKYVMIRSSQRGKANVRVKQEFVKTEGTSEKNDTLFDMLESQRDKLTDDGSPTRTLVFVGTKKQADYLAMMLCQKGVKAGSINGNRPQDERERMVSQLRDGIVHVLVGTDVCQRGLDINGLDHVINYDIPNGSSEEVRDKYIHRIGRTGRLHGGLATTFIDSHNSDVNAIKLIVQVAKETDQEIPPWLDELCNQDSFSRAGFGASSGSFGAKGFGSTSGFGAGGFGTKGFGGAPSSSGFGEGADKNDQESKDQPDDQELGSASFGEGGFGPDKKPADDTGSNDGSY
nr:DNA RNA helicase domain containing protein [Haemonchus contortus]